MASATKQAKVAVVVGLAAGAVALGTGIALARTYRPSIDFLGRSVAGGSGSEAWSRSNLGATVVLLAAAVAAGVLAVRAQAAGRLGRGGARRGVILAGTVVALVAAVLALLTRPLVAWDQIALRSVRTGTDVQGYWFGAFSDDVVFVLVDGVEVSQREYAVVLLAHLGAPVLAVVALAVVAAAVLRRSGDGTPQPA